MAGVCIKLVAVDAQDTHKNNKLQQFVDIKKNVFFSILYDKDTVVLDNTRTEL